MIGPAMFERCSGAYTYPGFRKDFTIWTFVYKLPGPKSMRSRWCLARQASNKRRNRR